MVVMYDIVFFIFFVFIWQMIQMYNEEKLWGYLLGCDNWL